MPIFSISGSPVTTNGTITETLVTQTANLVFAGPTTGSAAQPTFRALVSADLPFAITNLTDVGTDGIAVTNGTGAVIGASPVTIAQHVADASHNGYLSSTDWSTFNSKQAALTIGNLTDAGTDGIVVTGGTGAVIGSGTSIAQHVADASHNGYLSSTDWTTFNGKQASGNYITALTGDVTASGPGSVAATVAKIQGTTVSGTTGTTNVVFSSAPTLTNPVVGTQSQGDASTKAASTAYVDTAVANAVAGINPAVAVQAATTAAGDTSGFTYTHVAGIGDFFTGTVNTAVTIDGFTFTALGQRLLVKNDTQSPSGAFNGIYYVTQLQTGILAPVLTRALDYDTPSDINNTGAIPVINGTVNGTTQWVQTAQIVTVGTTPLVFAKFSGNPSTYLLAANNLSDVATKATAFNNLSPMTTAGDLVYGGASGAGTRLAVGAAFQSLSSDGTNPSWSYQAGSVNGSEGSGTTTLTISSNPNQITNLTAARTYVLPTTTVPAGYRMTITNTGDFALTIQSSDTTTCATLNIGTISLIANKATPTGKADWLVDRIRSKTSYSTTWSFGGGSGGGTSGSTTMVLEREGNFVRIYAPGGFATSGTSNTQWNANTAMPAAFAPAANAILAFNGVRNNGGADDAAGILDVLTTGVLRVQRNDSGTAFTNASSCGFQEDFHGIYYSAL